MREVTGRHVLAITVGAFAIIIGVNVVMAVQAIRTFPGLEVANGYVASQTFDADRKAQEALGWTLQHDYTGGRLVLDLKDSDGLPAPVRKMDVLVGRATEAKDDMRPLFARVAGRWETDVTLARGKWMLMVEAEAMDGTKFRQRLDLLVQDGAQE